MTDEIIEDLKIERKPKLAERVVAVLEACGLPRCRGGAMASNPRWNLPLGEWQAQFRHWIERPEPDALLNASIFFDLRPLAGELGLGQSLQAQIAEQAPRGRLFLTLLANEARHHRPPLGLFGRLRPERTGEHRGALDLKHGGLMPVVDLARLFSLQRGKLESLLSQHPLIVYRVMRAIARFAHEVLHRSGSQMAELTAYVFKTGAKY